MCWEKKYIFENDKTNAELSFYQVTLTQNDSLVKNVTFVTTNESLINIYIVRIHAQFVSQTAYYSLSDESSYIFSLYVDRPNPCPLLDCTIN